MDAQQLKRLAEVVEYADEIDMLFGQLKAAEEVIRLVAEYRRLNEVGVGTQEEVMAAYASMARAQEAYRQQYGEVE